ncbi:MAG: EAL domain-containing protein [Firmicutes bacterium]|nr:EAL domain-containing protein [Bacillota bacterium]
MNYVLDYEICSLIILSVVGLRFFILKRFPDHTCRMFSVLIVTAFFDIFFDIAGAFSIDHIAALPGWLCVFVNLIFYILQAALPMIMMTFVAFLCGMLDVQSIKRAWPLYVPYGVLLLLILTNHWHHYFIAVSVQNGVKVCSLGVGTLLEYLCSGFYVATSFVIAYRYRNQIELSQYNTMAFAVFTISITILLQVMFPFCLLTGVGITICVLMMCFTMQDPADMLDSASKMFNYRALERFLNNYRSYDGTMYMIAVDICNYNNVRTSMPLASFSKIIRDLGHFFNVVIYKSGWAFRMSDTRFLLITFHERKFQSLRNTIRYRINKPWKTDERSALLSATLCCSRQTDFSEPKNIIGVINMAIDELPKERQGSDFDIDNDCLDRGIRRSNVEKALRHSLASGKGFYLNFQPIRNIKTGGFTHAEVLLRMDTEELGPVSPREFIPIAVSCGLIRELDLMVVSRTCEFLQKHPELFAMGLKSLSINLSSPEHFTDQAATLTSTVRKYGIEPERLIFEMTETIALSNYTAAETMMRSMKNRGYSFFLDDFGTGYANILALRSLPFNCVKLDRFLVHADDCTGRILFDEMARLLSRLGVDVLAEGVETEEQNARAAASGSSYVQGFYYSQPLNGDSFIEFMEKNK